MRDNAGSPDTLRSGLLCTVRSNKKYEKRLRILLTERTLPDIIVFVARKEYRRLLRGVAQFGRALRSGRRGRGFKSRHLDHLTMNDIGSW